MECTIHHNYQRASSLKDWGIVLRTGRYRSLSRNVSSKKTCVSTRYGPISSPGTESVSPIRGLLVQIAQASEHVICVLHVKSVFVVVAAGQGEREARRDELDRVVLNMTVIADSMHARFSLDSSRAAAGPHAGSFGALTCLRQGFAPFTAEEMQRLWFLCNA